MNLNQSVSEFRNVAHMASLQNIAKKFGAKRLSSVHLLPSILFDQLSAAVLCRVNTYPIL